MYTNADALTNKMDELVATIKMNNPDIILSNEVMPKNARYVPGAAEFQLKYLGYEMYENLDNGKRGQVLYIKEEMKPKQIFIESDFEEFLTASIKLKGSDEMIIALLYRSPSSQRENIIAMNTLIDQIAELGYSHQLIIGDFNFKEIDWNNLYSSVEEQRTFIECTLQNSLVQHVN